MLSLISREEIVLWADDIIANADEPEYFFIEVSLSHDVNDLVEVLNKYFAAASLAQRNSWYCIIKAFALSPCILTAVKNCFHAQPRAESSRERSKRRGIS